MTGEDMTFFFANFFGFLIVLVLLTAHTERFSVSRMRDFYLADACNALVIR